MSLLQRRSKNSTSAPSTLAVRMSSYQNALWSRWQALSPRDQLALTLLSAFLLLFIGGYGGYNVHQASKESKAEYQEKVADYFWLRAQAGNIDTNAMNAVNTGDSALMPPVNSVSSLLNTSGIQDAQVIAIGNDVQLSFTNASQVVVSAALGKLEQQGWQFTQLSMEQDITTKYIQVQATVTS